MKLIIHFLFCLSFCFSPLYAQNADISLLRSINLNRDKSLDPSFDFITNSVNPVVIAVPIISFAAGCIAHDSALRKRGLYIGESLIVSAFVSTALKYSVQRPRPFVTYPDIEKQSSGGSYSFPSGHTSAAFSLATSVSIAWPRWYVVVPTYAWAAGVGYSRMHLGVHYPSDVLAGALVGSAAALLTHRLNKWVNRKTKHPILYY